MVPKIQRSFFKEGMSRHSNSSSGFSPPRSRPVSLHTTPPLRSLSTVRGSHAKSLSTQASRTRRASLSTSSSDSNNSKKRLSVSREMAHPEESSSKNSKPVAFSSRPTENARLVRQGNTKDQVRRSSVSKKDLVVESVGSIAEDIPQTAPLNVPSADEVPNDQLQELKQLSNSVRSVPDLEIPTLSHPPSGGEKRKRKTISDFSHNSPKRLKSRDEFSDLHEDDFSNCSAGSALDLVPPSDSYYFMKFGSSDESGPFTKLELSKLYYENTLRPEDLVWNLSLGSEWRSLFKCDELLVELINLSMRFRQMDTPTVKKGIPSAFVESFAYTLKQQRLRIPKMMLKTDELLLTQLNEFEKYQKQQFDGLKSDCSHLFSVSQSFVQGTVSHLSEFSATGNRLIELIDKFLSSSLNPDQDLLVSISEELQTFDKLKNLGIPADFVSTFENFFLKVKEWESNVLKILSDVSEFAEEEQDLVVKVEDDELSHNKDGFASIQQNFASSETSIGTGDANLGPSIERIVSTGTSESYLPVDVSSITPTYHILLLTSSMTKRLSQRSWRMT
jgi:hypothetical protein